MFVSVPLRSGGGTRLRLLEAMALGRPVVSTSIGCEGLAIEEGKHILVADNPSDFASAVCRLLGDRALRIHLAANARELVVTHYEWDILAARLSAVYSTLVAAPCNVEVPAAR